MLASASTATLNGHGPAYRPLGTFRFVLALLVVAQHFANFAPLPFQQAIVPLGIGSIAVLVFFAVSGFVIAEAIELHYRGRVGAFLVNRAIRIFPPLFGTMTVTILTVAVLLVMFGSFRSPDLTEAALVTPDVLKPGNIVGNYLHVFPGIKALGLRAEHPLIALVWSIRTELLFYLAMALLMLAPQRHYHRVLFGAGLAGFAVFAVTAMTGYGPDSLAFIPFFVFGVAAYYAITGSVAGLILAVVAAGLSLVAFCLEGQAIHPVLKTLFGPYDMTARSIVLAILLPAIPALALLKVRGTSRIDRMLGDLSYPLYLNHILVMYVVRAFWPQIGWAGLLAATLAALLVSYAMYRLIEPGLNGLRNRVRGTGKPVSAPRRSLSAAPFADVRVARLPV